MPGFISIFIVSKFRTPKKYAEKFMFVELLSDKNWAPAPLKYLTQFWTIFSRNCFCGFHRTFNSPIRLPYDLFASNIFEIRFCFNQLKELVAVIYCRVGIVCGCHRRQTFHRSSRTAGNRFLCVVAICVARHMCDSLGRQFIIFTQQKNGVLFLTKNEKIPNFFHST